MENIKHIKEFLGKFLFKLKQFYTVYEYDPQNRCMREIDVENISDNKDVYFRPNIGRGLKTTDISYFTCAFVDCDAGRNKNGKYKTPSQVSAFKQKLKKFFQTPHKEFPKPSIVVETRNGYQLYWLFEKKVFKTNDTLRQWETLEKRLISCFKNYGGDIKVNKPGQLMRVPYTYWNKKNEGAYAPFLCKVLNISMKRYTFQQMLDSTSKVAIYTNSSIKFNKYSVIPKNIRAIPMTYSNVKIQPYKNIVENKPQEQNSVLSDVKDFLLECSKQLFYSGHKFSSKTATRLAQQLEREYAV